MKCILIISIIIWIAVIYFMQINNIIVGPLLTIAFILLFGYIIYGLIYFYNSIYDCKCSISRIGSILGFMVLIYLFSIPISIYLIQTRIENVIKLQNFLQYISTNFRK